MGQQYGAKLIALTKDDPWNSFQGLVIWKVHPCHDAIMQQFVKQLVQIRFNKEHIKASHFCTFVSPIH